MKQGLLAFKYEVETRDSGMYCMWSARFRRCSKKAIKDGMRTLIMDGIQKVFQGITDLEEILQICRYERK